jgi:hypothetical protein
MPDHNTMLASQQLFPETGENNSYSQYLSFRFYKENIDHLTDMTKDSINNFLKTISEIEDDFVNALQNQRMKNLELHDLGFDGEAGIYMEENY